MQAACAPQFLELLLSWELSELLASRRKESGAQTQAAVLPPDQHLGDRALLGAGAGGSSEVSRLG